MHNVLVHSARAFQFLFCFSLFFFLWMDNGQAMWQGSQWPLVDYCFRHPPSQISAHTVLTVVKLQAGPCLLSIGTFKTNMWKKTKKILRSRKSRINDKESSSSPCVRVVANNSCNNKALLSNETKNLPLLYGLSKSWAWPAVEFRCQSHPQEASAEYRDDAGDNCLHRVCYGKPPLETVNMLLAACPELASFPNKQGSLPLHGEFLLQMLSCWDRTVS